MYKCAISPVYPQLIHVLCPAINRLFSPRHFGDLMSPPFHPTRVIGNLAALVGAILVAGFLFDLAACWWDYRPMALCMLLEPVLAVAYAIGVLLTSLGVIIYAVSMFRSQAGIGLAVGGVLLFVLPLTLPRYLGVICSY